MTATLIDGKRAAAELRARVATEVHRLAAAHGLTLGLAVVLVGDNPASATYVTSKKKMSAQSGIRSFDHRLPGTISEVELLALITQLNGDPSIHGILVQLPLPPQIDANTVIEAVDPTKDVDGFHPMNAGRLALGCHRWRRARRLVASSLQRSSTLRSLALRLSLSAVRTLSVSRWHSFSSGSTQPSRWRIRKPAISRWYAGGRTSSWLRPAAPGWCGASGLSPARQ